VTLPKSQEIFDIQPSRVRNEAVDSAHTDARCGA
jgi:hypothetical protein